MRDTLRNSMDELMQFARGESSVVTVKEYTLSNLPAYDNPSEIKAIRSKKKMTQKVFSDVLGVSVRTVEAWESGQSHPNGSARRLMQLIDKNPNLIEEIEEVAAKG